jgi:hypothetical protein
MADKYPGMSPYNYCANNPLNTVDPNGEDWYKDESGWYQYDPLLTAENQFVRLGKGCKYIGPSLQGTRLKNYGLNAVVDLNEDGSIFFYNENAAYSYMKQTSKQYHVETMGLITASGVLVAPYWLQVLGQEEGDAEFKFYYQVADRENGIIMPRRTTYRGPISSAYNVLAIVHVHLHQKELTWFDDYKMSYKYLYGRPMMLLRKNNLDGIYYPNADAFTPINIKYGPKQSAINYLIKNKPMRRN